MNRPGPERRIERANVPAQKRAEVLEGTHDQLADLRKEVQNKLGDGSVMEKFENFQKSAVLTMAKLGSSIPMLYKLAAARNANSWSAKLLEYVAGRFETKLVIAAKAAGMQIDLEQVLANNANIETTVTRLETIAKYLFPGKSENDALQLFGKKIGENGIPRSFDELAKSAEVALADQKKEQANAPQMAANTATQNFSQTNTSFTGPDKAAA